MFNSKLLVLAISLTCFYYFLRILRFLYYFNKLPGRWVPLRKQFLTIVFEMVGKSEAERYKILKDYAKQYPEGAKLWFGPMFLYFPQNPQVIQKILSSNSMSVMEKPFFYKFINFGIGLITSPARVWRPHRRILNGAFNMTALQSYLPFFNACSKNFVQGIEHHVDGEPFNILQHAVKCTLDNTCCE